MIRQAKSAIKSLVLTLQRKREGGIAIQLRRRVYHDGSERSLGSLHVQIEGTGYADHPAE